MEELVDTKIRCNGMYGLLCEIIGKGALSPYGDKDLVDRVKQAIADHEAANRDQEGES